MPMSDADRKISITWLYDMASRALSSPRYCLETLEAEGPIEQDFVENGNDLCRLVGMMDPPG